MAFDFSNMATSPSFQMGLGLLGAARPRNRPLLDAYQIINQMQQQQMEQQKIKQYLELQQAQEKRLEEQSKLYGRQVATAEEKAKREAAMGKLFEQMLPGLMGGQQPPAAQIPTPPQPTQPAMSPTSRTFNLADKFVAGVEGGFVPNDAGKGPTNFGVNQLANPDVNVRNLTEATAQQVRRRYWDNIQGDQIEQVYGPQAAMVAYDAAINQGQDYAKKLIEKTGGNPTLMLYQRRQDYRDLAKSPLKAPYLKGWEKRLDQLSQQIEGAQAPAAPAVSAPPQQAGATVVDNRYRDLQRASAAFKGMGGDYAGALEGFAGAMKPEVRKPGDIIIGPDGRQHQIPDPLGERRVAADEAGVNIRQQTEQRQLQTTQRESSAQLAKDRAAYTTVTAATGGIKTKVDELLSDPALKGLEGLWGAVGQIPGSAAYDTRQNLESLKSEIANTLLQAVRNASANGASGYGQFTEKELGVIQSMVAPIKPGMTDKALRASLMKIRNYMDTLEGQATKLYEDAHGKSPIEGLPAGARQIGTSGGKPVYETPDGKRWVGQ